MGIVSLYRAQRNERFTRIVLQGSPDPGECKYETRECLAAFRLEEQDRLKTDGVAAGNNWAFCQDNSESWGLR